MFAKIYNSLASLTLGLWLMGGTMALLAAGSFAGRGEQGSINDMALFTWLARTPISESWWLWGTVALLALMALNTVLCSIEAIRRRYGQTRLTAILAPQLMHLGFLLIVLAHLLSAKGGAKGMMQVYPGSPIGFPDGSTVWIGTISVTPGPMGMPSDYSAEVRAVAGGRETSGTISPNAPFFHGGFGIYLKEAATDPIGTALIEIHREPGAGWALAGALLFTAGNVALLAVRRGKQEG